MAKGKGGGRSVNKSAITGRFVSRKTVSSNPKTTYRQTTKRKTRWAIFALAVLSTTGSGGSGDKMPLSIPSPLTNSGKSYQYSPNPDAAPRLFLIGQAWSWESQEGAREIKKQKGGRIVVEIRGVDVYDPTTGQIRSASTEDIACWFIDTDYNDESFFVRHTYFTGADAPYDKLKRALRAKTDEAAWRSLYTTVSQPFDKPESGKIAVKVINHYGDEVLKVFGV